MSERTSTPQVEETVPVQQSEAPALEVAPEVLETSNKDVIMASPNKEESLDNNDNMDTIPLDTKEPDHYITIRIYDVIKVGEKSINSYVKYAIETKTNLPYFRSETSTVERRFSDFLGLREKLAQKHMVDGFIVLPAPEKNAIATFQTKMTKEEDITSHNEFLERRKCALERFLNRIAQHPVLRTDPDFRDFLELQAELPRSTSTSALSKEGMKRLFGQVTESVTKMGYRMDESDKWFDEKALQLDNLDTQLMKLHTSVGALIHHRKLLTVTTGNFARSVAILGNVEEYTPLSFDLSKLATTKEKIEHLYADQVNNDFYLISELLHDYINLISAIKEVFQHRIKVYQNWQQAQQTLARKREQKQRNDLMVGRSDKLNQDIAEYEARVQRGQEEFEKISKNIKKDVEKFELDRVKEFQANMMKYLETLLEGQKKLVEYWEGFLTSNMDKRAVVE